MKQQQSVQTSFKALFSDDLYYVYTRTYSVVIELPLFYISLLLLPVIVLVILDMISMPSVGSCLQQYASGELMSRMSEMVNPSVPELNTHCDLQEMEFRWGFS